MQPPVPPPPPSSPTPPPPPPPRPESSQPVPPPPPVVAEPSVPAVTATPSAPPVPPAPTVPPVPAARVHAIDHDVVTRPTDVAAPSHPIRRSRTPMVVALVVLAALAGAGTWWLTRSDDSPDGLTAAVRNALVAAGDPSKDAAFDQTTTSTVNSTPVTVTRSGQVDGDTKVLDVTVTVTPGDGSAASAPVNLVVNGLERIVYIRASTFPNGDTLATGKTWIEVDQAVKDGRDISQQFLNAARNPLDVLGALSAGTVRDVGLLTIGTEELRHVEVTLTGPEMAAANPSLQETLDSTGGRLPETMVFDVFLTKDQRLRRLDNTADFGDGPVTSTLVVRDLDGPVEITAPVKANSVKLSSLTGGLTG